MTWLHAANRILYYVGDLPLLWRTVAAYLRAYYFTDDSRLPELAVPETRRKPREIDRIRNCVGACFRLGSKVGMNNTCLIHSVVLCRLLNQHGFTASVVFAAKKDEKNKMVGHCWVAVDNVDMPDDWHVIFKYP